MEGPNAAAAELHAHCAVLWARCPGLRPHLERARDMFCKVAARAATRGGVGSAYVIHDNDASKCGAMVY